MLKSQCSNCSHRICNLHTKPCTLQIFSMKLFLKVLHAPSPKKLPSVTCCSIFANVLFTDLAEWSKGFKSAQQEHNSSFLFGRARRSRDGLMESCTCRCHWCAGPPLPQGGPLASPCSPPWGGGESGTPTWCHHVISWWGRSAESEYTCWMGCFQLKFGRCLPAEKSG